MNSPYIFTYSPASQSFFNLGTDAQMDFTETLVTYTVNGQVRGLGGAGMGGVTVQFDKGAAGQTQTDASGNYSIVMPAGPSYSVEPAAAGYNFSPAPQNIKVTDNRTAHFTARKLFTVSGHITDKSGNPLGDVNLAFGNSEGSSQSRKSAADGSYSFDLIESLSYTVTPSKLLYGFNPASPNINNVSGHMTLNFTAALPETEIKTWTQGDTTYAHVKLIFPTSGYRVAGWGQVANAGADYSSNATLEKMSGPAVQAVATTVQIYTLGTLAPGNYNFIFKNQGAVLKSHPFNISAAPPPPNPIDTQREFVRWQYKDFLGREPDQAGWDFWTANITKCNNPAQRAPGHSLEQCLDFQRTTTSAAFFLSPEFQYTGYYVYRLYKGALGRAPYLSEFTLDQQTVGSGIIVGGQLYATAINQNKALFATAFASRAEFHAAYDGLSNEQYVSKLFQTMGITPTEAERGALVNGLNTGAETRAAVLQKAVDGILIISEGQQEFTTTYGKTFYDREFNNAFVLMEYFGYMHRDADEAGYAFWLSKLNSFSNYVDAEMVRSFVVSPEYRARFGQP